MSSQIPPASDPSGHRKSSAKPAREVSPEQAAYNKFSDTVTGVNIRMSDNLFQAIFILVVVLIGAVAGMITGVVVGSFDYAWLAGMLAGSFIGLIVGFFASGIVLMIFRARRHLKGQHD